MWGVLSLLVGLFTLVSLLFFHPEDLPFYSSHPKIASGTTSTGLIGGYIAFGLKFTFGSSAILIPALFLLWAACFFLQQVPEKKLFKFLGLGIALFSTSTLIAISVNTDTRFDQAGVIGYLAGTYLLKYLGYAGSFILAASCLLLSLLLATDFLIYPLVKHLALIVHKISEGILNIFSKARRLFPERNSEVREPLEKESKLKKSKEKLQPEPSVLKNLPPVKVKRYQPLASEEEEEPAKLKEAALKIKKEPATFADSRPPVIKKAKEEEKATVPETHEGVVGSRTVSSDYQFPPIDLLKKPEKGEVVLDNLQQNTKILEDTLADFGIEVKVVEVEQGPVITRYELMPAPGVKVNSIAVLSDDIALALKAASVRLIIPIPGKSAIGVEVPNSVASKVVLRELIDSPMFRAKKFALPLALGKNTSGKPFTADLAAMPHMLIAGTTGSGKTVCVNSIILGFIYSCSPDELKFVMVDPKMVELAVYNKIPHMLSPVVTDTKKAAHTLNWVVSEMENRYRLLATVGVRNIQAFNARPLSDEAIAETEGVESPNVIPPKLPYIVVVIDELADLMMVAQDKVEGAITRLAQLSRAVGIHLILATQRPSVDVITGVIKANFPARVSFKVSSKVDSRTVLDCNGGDKLLGKGDLLFLQPGSEKPMRGQAPFVTDEEINAVVEFVSKQGKPEYHPEIQAAQEGKKTDGGTEERDELFEEAVQIIIQTGQASTSNLQRRLKLGYTRAARIIDQMEAAGIVGPAQGAKPREIYGRSQTEPVTQNG